MKRTEKIQITGDGISVEYVEVSETTAQQIRRGLLDEQSIQKLVDDGACECGVCSAIVEVNGATVSKVDGGKIHPGTPYKIEPETGSWFLVRVSSERGIFRNIQVPEVYNSEKLLCSREDFELNGFHFFYLSFRYEHIGQSYEGEFGETYSRSEESFLLSPAGEKIQIRGVEDRV